MRPGVRTIDMALHREGLSMRMMNLQTAIYLCLLAVGVPSYGAQESACLLNIGAADVDTNSTYIYKQHVRY